ncbi:MAG: serine/threonine protein kinase, partial [Planctomycetes bacterium]|nr:serine/threonine protein kinase [Planctomycetota bacterium]
MAETKDRNQEIGRLAVARYMADKEQVDECFRALKEGGGGSGATLAEILAQRGYVTAVQRDSLLAETAPAGAESESVGGYQLIKLIGKGGMGSVYRARQVSLDRIVALKVLNRQLHDNVAYRERFLREARAVGGLNHPHIVRAIDAGEDGGNLYFAMELVDGRNVTAHLQEGGPFREARAAAVGRQVALALAHAWRHGIVHRDIKPENILIDRDGVAKLTDLGLAKSTGEERRITQAGMAMGTPYYISPEQIRLAETLDVRADLYALGATMFHMVTGRPPYLADSSAAVVSMHVSAPVPDPRQYAPGLSPALCAVLMKLMAKDAKDRFQTPEELVAALDALDASTAAAYLATGGPAAAPAGAAAEPQGVGFGFVMAIVTFMALAALAFFLLFGGEKTDPGPGETLVPVSPGPGPEAPPAPDPGEKKGKAETPPPPDEPGPKAPPGPSEHEALLREAEKHLDQHPDDFAGGFARLEAIQRKHPGTTSAMLAKKKAEALAARLGDAARSALSDPEQGIEVRARRLLDQGKYAEGLALFDAFPQALRAGTWTETLEAARGRYVDEARGRVQKALRRAKELEARKKYQDALLILADAKALGVPEFAKRIREDEDRIRGLRSDRLFADFASSLLRGTTGRGL